jgi:hypothetical protein
MCRSAAGAGLTTWYSAATPQPAQPAQPAAVSADAETATTTTAIAMYREPEVCCPSIFLNFKLMCGVADAIFTGTTEHMVTWRAYAFITSNWQCSFVSGFRTSALASPRTITTGWPHTYRRLEPEELYTINFIQLIETES